MERSEESAKVIDCTPLSVHVKGSVSYSSIGFPGVTPMPGGRGQVASIYGQKTIIRIVPVEGVETLICSGTPPFLVGDQLRVYIGQGEGDLKETEHPLKIEKLDGEGSVIYTLEV